MHKIKGGIMLEENKFVQCVVRLRLLQAATLAGCDLQMHCNNLHLNVGQSEPASKVWGLRVLPQHSGLEWDAAK